MRWLLFTTASILLVVLMVTPRSPVTVLVAGLFFALFVVTGRMFNANGRRRDEVPGSQDR